MPVLYPGNQLFQACSKTYQDEEKEISHEVAFLENFKAKFNEYLGAGSCSVTVDVQNCEHNFDIDYHLAFTLVVFVDLGNGNVKRYEVPLVGKTSSGREASILVKDDLGDELPFIFNGLADNSSKYDKILEYVKAQFPRRGVQQLLYS